MIRALPFLLCLLSGCGLFFPRGPYGRIPDLQAQLEHQQKPALFTAKADSCLESAENSAGLGTAILDPAAFAKLSPGAQRRYARALRASTPRKLKGSGIVYAPANAGSIDNTSAVGKNAVAATDSAQVINAPKADNVAGPGATQTVAEAPTGFPWWGWVLIAALAYGAIRVFNRLTS